MIQEDVVEFSPDLELQGAEGVVDVLDAVANPMSEVVHGVYLIFCACPRVRLTLPPVYDGVPEGGVLVGWVVLQPQSLVKVQVGKYPKRLLNTPTSVRVASFLPSLSLNRGLVAVTDVGMSLLDELVGVEHNLVEVVTAEVNLIRRVPQPLDVPLNLLNRLL